MCQVGCDFKGHNMSNYLTRSLVLLAITATIITGCFSANVRVPKEVNFVIPRQRHPQPPPISVSALQRENYNLRCRNDELRSQNKALKKKLDKAEDRLEDLLDD